MHGVLSLLQADGPWSLCACLVIIAHGGMRFRGHRRSVEYFIDVVHGELEVTM